MRRLLIIAMLVLTPTMARADWDFTKWSMTADQVQAASKGRAVRLEGSAIEQQTTFTNEGRCLLQMKGYQVAGIQFEKVNFCFDAETGKLSAVDLYTTGDNYFAVDRALRSSFGQPASQSGGSVPERIYNDQKKGNTLRLVRVYSTILHYQPIVRGF